LQSFFSLVNQVLGRILRNKRTASLRCHKRTLAPQQDTCSADHFICARDPSGVEHCYRIARCFIRLTL
jgi:hypothetical protein